LADLVGVVEARRERQERRDAREADAGLELAADRLGEARKVLGRELGRLLADRHQHLLLSLGTAEVALQVAVTRAHVLHGVEAIQMLRPAEYGDSLVVVRPAAVDVRGV